MNIINKLHDLQQEILSFGNVVNQVKNPADTDFRNACDLFSKYLNFELQAINSNICLKDIRPEMQQTTAQLHKLSELITPDTSDSNEQHQWTKKLLNFCNQLQTLKSIAA